MSCWYELINQFDFNSILLLVVGHSSILSALTHTQTFGYPRNSSTKALPTKQRLSNFRFQDRINDIPAVFFWTKVGLVMLKSGGKRYVDLFVVQLLCSRRLTSQRRWL